MCLLAKWNGCLCYVFCCLIKTQFSSDGHSVSGLDYIRYWYSKIWYENRKIMSRTLCLVVIAPNHHNMQPSENIVQCWTLGYVQSCPAVIWSGHPCGYLFHGTANNHQLCTVQDHCRSLPTSWPSIVTIIFSKIARIFLIFSTFSIFTRFFSSFTTFFSILKLDYSPLFCNILRSDITFRSGTSNVMHVPCVPTKGHDLRPRGSNSNPARNIQ